MYKKQSYVVNRKEGILVQVKYKVGIPLNFQVYSTKTRAITHHHRIMQYHLKSLLLLLQRHGKTDFNILLCSEENFFM